MTEQTRMTEDRVAVAAAYWLDASPHERTEEDGLILAQYARQAMNEIRRLREENEKYRRALAKIVCLNMPMPDEVFEIANNALEGE